MLRVGLQLLHFFFPPPPPLPPSPPSLVSFVWPPPRPLFGIMRNVMCTSYEICFELFQPREGAQPPARSSRPERVFCDRHKVSNGRESFCEKYSNEKVRLINNWLVNVWGCCDMSRW